MRILIAHNRYQYLGGEDSTVDANVDLLRSRGVEVEQFSTSNRDIIARGKVATAVALWRSPFNRAVYKQVRALCREKKPDAVHVHNFWFCMLSIDHHLIAHGFFN